MAEDTARDLRGVLDRVKKAGDGEDQVNVGEILETVGQHSFGPILIVISLIAFTPLGAVPGVPTLLATLVVLIAGQILFGVRHFRLPQAILRRHMEREKFTRSLGFTRKAARAVDAILKPRLSWLFSGPYVRVAALGCILVALTVPPLEVLPFAGTVSWAAIAAFGLALVAHDGLFAIVALGFAATTPYVIWTTLFWETTMIDVSRTDDGDPMTFRVVVRDEEGTTRHEVTMARKAHQDLTPGHTPEQLVEAAFRFLLDREPKESILGRFDVTIIPTYFPEFHKELPAYLD